MTVTELAVAQSAPSRRIDLPRGRAAAHLDALRGIAALLVMVSHWRRLGIASFPAPAAGCVAAQVLDFVMDSGHQWVIVFFVLSGYLVGGSVLRSVSEDRWSWREYLFVRLTRLYVVLIPALMIGGLLDWTGSHLPGGAAEYTAAVGDHALIRDGIYTLTPKIFAGNLLFLQTMTLPVFGVKPLEALGTNGVLWSLCNEFWYYLCFPLGVLAFAKGKRPVHRAILLVAIGILSWFIGLRMFVMGLSWLAGALLHFAPEIKFRSRVVQLTALLTALIVMICGFELERAWDLSIGSDLCLGMCVAGLIWVIVHSADGAVLRSYKWLAKRTSQSSYTLYLVHCPMLIFLKSLILGVPLASSGARMAVALGLLAGTLLYAQIMYQLFEKHTDSVRRTLRKYAGFGTILARPGVESAAPVS
jgi:peptidoglycan/LPS O-acetylase OafA/YrhL